MKTLYFRPHVILILVVIFGTGCLQKASKQELTSKHVLNYEVNEEDRRFRWDVKTLHDQDAVYFIKYGMPWQHQRTISELVTWSFPGELKDTSSRYSNPRGFNDESNVISVIGSITEYVLEGDGDIHLVLSDGSNTLIAEVPDPDSIASTYRKECVAVRKWLSNKLGAPTNEKVLFDKKDAIKAAIVGIPFFDKKHGQDGVADNCIEIHPILGISLQKEN